MRNNSITVLIPTRERAEYLVSAIKSCTAQTYQNCRFVVSDNASLDDTRDIVLSFKDPRLLYVNPGRRVSMSSNFEYALSHASPGYVISIGDDDALMPDALEYIDGLIDETNSECIGGRWNCYFWKTYPVPAMQNSMYVWVGQGYSYKQSAAEVRRALNFNYSYVHRLAGLYYGAISTRLIERLRFKGVFFQSITPDSYSAFACTLATRRFVFSHKPFVLAGLSGKSNGTSQLLNGDSSEAVKFLEENTHQFHQALVYCPAEAVIMAEAFLQLADCHPELTRGVSFSIRTMCVAALRQSSSTSLRNSIEPCIREIASRGKLNMDDLIRAAKIPDILARTRKELDEFRYPHYLTHFSEDDINDIASAAIRAELLSTKTHGKRLQAWAASQLSRISRRIGAGRAVRR
jgi:hypothetical protein